MECHKARLQAEFTKARLRRRCATVGALKTVLLADKPSLGRQQPRWVRVNTLKTTLEVQLGTTFDGYRSDATLSEVSEASKSARILHVDQDVPDLLALPPELALTNTQAYRDGAIILQDKASCFPAYLLVGHNPGAVVGDSIDGCAAPGNKTSHLAALFSRTMVPNAMPTSRKIFACERDATRSQTLQDMVSRAGTTNVTVLAGQDFLSLDPRDPRFRNVTHVLLDPSCSGSGILGREDVPNLILPTDPKVNVLKTTPVGANSRKRKHGKYVDENFDRQEKGTVKEEENEVVSGSGRLQKLANLQTRIVQHGFAFPAATRLSYSTCSVHVEENEMVVARALRSAIAKQRGWRVLRRDEQIARMMLWKHRGIDSPATSGLDLQDSTEALGDNRLTLSAEEREACIRCNPGDDQGTMGFFVCAFVRPVPEESDWEGFSDAG